MSTRRALPLLLAGLLAFSLSAQDQGEAPGPPVPPATNSALIWKDRVLTTDEDGRVRAWDAQEGSPDRALALHLARIEPTWLASDGGTLWGVADGAVHSWEAVEQRWMRRAEIEAPTRRVPHPRPRGAKPLLPPPAPEPEALQAFAIVEGRPLLVFESRVLDPLGGPGFEGKDPGEEHPWRDLRVHAVHVAGPCLALGNGYGEWGGDLRVLDTRTGSWSGWRDDLHGVTGIAQHGPQELLVTWSNSHLRADSRLRVHALDASVRHEFPEQEGAFFQQVACLPGDDMPWTVDARRLVRLKDGTPQSVVELGDLAFAGESRAAGVASSVHALLPVAPGRLLVVPVLGLPWRLESGRLVRLDGP